MSVTPPTFSDFFLPPSSGFNLHLLHTLFNGAVDAMIMVDDTGLYLEVNPTACKLFELQKSELIGRRLIDFMEASFNFDDFWTTILEQEAAQGEIAIVRQDGSIRFTNFYTTAHVMPHCHLFILKDITQAKLALQASEDRYRDLITAIEGIAWEFNLSTGLFTFMSSAMEVLLGYPVTRWYQERGFWARCIHPEDNPWVITGYKNAIQNKQPRKFEYRMLTAQGDTIWLQDAASLVIENEQATQLRGILLDITDRKQIEIALRESEKQNQALLSTIPDGIVLMNRTGDYLAVRQRALASPVPPDGWQGKNLRDYFSKPIVEECLAAFQTVLTAKTMQVVQFEFEKDNLTYYREVRIFPYDQDIILAITQDISDRKKIEHALQDSEAELRGLFAAMNDYIFVLSSEGRYLKISPSQPHFIHKLNHTLHDVLPKVKADYFLAIIQQVLSNQQPQALEYSLFIQGKEVWFSTLISPINQSSVLWVARDITDRKDAELALQQMNTTLEFQIQDRTYELQQALDFEATLKRITDQVRDSLDEQQILSKAIAELVAVLKVDRCHTSFYDRDYTQTMISCSSYDPPRIILPMDVDSEIYAQLLDGQLLQFCRLETKPLNYNSILVCPLLDQDRVMGDIWLYQFPPQPFDELAIRLIQQVANQCAIGLRQARLYQSAQAQVRELANLNQLKDDFLSTVSHELRTPLNNMTIALEMLKRNIKPEHTSFYLQILEQECKREKNLINNLLELQELKAQQRNLQLESINLPQWLASVILPFETQILKSSSSLSMHIDPLLGMIHSDPKMLNTVVVELLHNAFKYADLENPEITLCVYQLRQDWCLEISNNGLTIPPEALPHIFDHFYRVPNNNPWKQGGTGLGLALVKQLVEALQGQLTVVSDSSVTRFRVTTPIWVRKDS